MENATSESESDSTKQLASDSGADNAKQLSKRQLKLMKRRQEWLSQKSERRVREKEKKKEKRRQKVESGVDLGPSRKLLKKNTMKDSKCAVTVAIDLSFDDLMTDKDINKLGQQIQYCYSRNRRAPEPLQFHLTSLGVKTKQRLETVGDYKSWDINLNTESYSDVFDASRIVYLTSDSANVLDTLDPTKVYIIGGLVDHNHHKGFCYQLAVEKGINHARLPIDEYCKLNTRRVLTINHVFEILLRFTEISNWAESFYQVIPKRKQAVEINKSNTEEVDEVPVVEGSEARGTAVDEKLLIIDIDSRTNGVNECLDLTQSAINCTEIDLAVDLANNKCAVSDSSTSSTSAPTS